MKSRKQWLKEVASLCAEIGPEDGVDPRQVFHQTTRKQSHRKTYQVCKQAEKTLNLVLASESVDPLLRELVVRTVEPAPDSAHLLVIVEVDLTTQSEHEVREAFERANGQLRSAIAMDINRKRAPQISFRLIAADFISFDRRDKGAIS